MLLANGLPEDGAVKKAQRDGRWPDWKQMLADVLTEQYRMRATYNLARWGDDYWFDAEDFAPIDPSLQARHAEAAQSAAQQAEAAVDDFNAEIGFS